MARRSVCASSGSECIMVLIVCAFLHAPPDFHTPHREFSHTTVGIFTPSTGTSRLLLRSLERERERERIQRGAIRADRADASRARCLCPRRERTSASLSLSLSSGYVYRDAALCPRRSRRRASTARPRSQRARSCLLPERQMTPKGVRAVREGASVRETTRECPPETLFREPEKRLSFSIPVVFFRNPRVNRSLDPRGRSGLWTVFPRSDQHASARPSTFDTPRDGVLFLFFFFPFHVPEGLGRSPSVSLRKLPKVSPTNGNWLAGSNRVAASACATHTTLKRAAPPHSRRAKIRREGTTF